MRLKTNIFVWVFAATVAPLLALVLGATAYSQHLYQREVARDVNSSLSSVVSEIDRSLYYERQLVASLAGAPAMRQYLPVLEMATRGQRHPTLYERGERLNRFLSAFQGVVPNFHTLRVMDVFANTMIKVRFGHGSVGVMAGIESSPYVERPLEESEFAARLAKLPPEEVSFVPLPESRWERDGLRGPPMLNAVVPLSRDGRTVGYLMADFSGEQIDRILELAPRVHGAELLIAEVNPDHGDRNGIVLFDDASGLRFSRAETVALNLHGVGDGRLWQAVRRKPYGDLASAGGMNRIYYLEYLPYPNQFASWVVAARVDMKEVNAPFDRIRAGILLFAAAALVISLALAHLGARQIAQPVTELARGLKRYADGDAGVRVQAHGAQEIRQLESSFNYMADTLEHTQRERDRAQRMVMQSDKLASIGQMAAGIGHEINNPLNNILSLCKLMERSLPADAGRLRGDVASVREEALRASGVVSGVLNFARQVEPRCAKFEVHPWLEETLALVQRSAGDRGVHVEMRAAGEHTLEGDRGQLQQVLVNLLLNAIQASPEGGTVTVDVERGGGGLLIQVRDQGRGIDPAVIDKVFDPFFTTKPVGEGSGLGLSISLGIVERHNGRLSIENGADGGAVATVRLPPQQDLCDDAQDRGKGDV